MRSKEDAQDYRYFPDPDLLPLVVTEDQIEKVRATLPELPSEKRERFLALGLNDYQASLLTSDRELARVSSEIFQKAPSAEIARLANWLTGPIAALQNEQGEGITYGKIDIYELPILAQRVSDGTISSSAAATIIPIMWNEGGKADAIIEARGLKQISDAGAIEKLVDEVLAKNPKQVEDYRAGKDKAFNSLVGQVMKATQGKANPAQVNEILRNKLGR
jgi:aspartyl-tRNA(Asn)/glutamyl-tRNA(Gln) amidotransferase subunit B